NHNKAIPQRMSITHNPHNNLPNNYVYTIAALTDTNCTANAGDRTGNAILTINPRPKSLVSGSTTICNGVTPTIQASLNGIGPWTVPRSVGFVQTTNENLGSSVIET